MSHDNNLAMLLEAIDQNLEDAKLYNELGGIYLNLGRFEESLSAYRKAFDLEPQNAYLQNSLGNVYRHLGQYDQAILAFKRAIVLDPQFSYPHHNMGNVYAELGQYEDAILANKKAIELDPQFGHAYAVIASAERHLGRQPTEPIIAKCRELIPENEYYNRACVESIAGNIDAALILLQKVSQGGLELAKNDPDFEFIRDDPNFKKLVGLDSTK